MKQSTFNAIVNVLQLLVIVSIMTKLKLVIKLIFKYKKINNYFQVASFNSVENCSSNKVGLNDKTTTKIISELFKKVFIKYKYHHFCANLSLYIHNKR